MLEPDKLYNHWLIYEDLTKATIVTFEYEFRRDVKCVGIITSPHTAISFVSDMTLKQMEFRNLIDDFNDIAPDKRVKEFRYNFKKGEIIQCKVWQIGSGSTSHAIILIEQL